MGLNHDYAVCEFEPEHLSFIQNVGRPQRWVTVTEKAKMFRVRMYIVNVKSINLKKDPGRNEEQVKLCVGLVQVEFQRALYQYQSRPGCARAVKSALVGMSRRTAGGCMLERERKRERVCVCVGTVCVRVCVVCE